MKATDETNATICIWTFLNHCWARYRISYQKDAPGETTNISGPLTYEPI